MKNRPFSTMVVSCTVILWLFSFALFFISSGAHREFWQLVGEWLGLFWLVCLPSMILSVFAAAHNGRSYINWLCCFTAVAFFVLGALSIVSLQEPPKFQLVTFAIFVVFQYVLLAAFFLLLLFAKAVLLIVGNPPRPNQALE